MLELSSLDRARAAFDEYVALEPKLAELWSLCRAAAPPARAADQEADIDPFELDLVAIDDGWCAEDYFFEHVKSPLMLLVGLQRPSGPEELRTTRAYDTVYAALLDWALNRPCACCSDTAWTAPAIGSPA